MSRTKSTIINFSVAIIGQILGLIASFIARIFFIRYLGNEYLGLNGLFTNILTVLSLAELGVGNAIIYSLYKPLAEKDEKKCKMLMQLYKKIYIVVGLFILILGISIVPLLPVFIKDMPDIDEINYIYILFVLNTAISYFFSYKRNLIIADQNRYIATIFRYSFYVLLNICQIIYLIISSDYIGFLVLQILATLLENICISFKADKMYSYLKDKEKIPLEKETKNEIIKNTKAMMMHKIGGTVVSATDNILLSSIVGLQAVGLYSNYYMVTYALNLFFTQLYNSLTPSIGNLCVTSDEKKKFEVFKNIDFLTFYIYSLSFIGLLLLYNLFITVWIGVDYLFDFSIVFIISLNFFLTGMRKSVLAFREAQGLFYKDRWKSIIEAIINLIASILLGIKFGTIGIFLGTLISSITTCVWVEPYILYKYAFKVNIIEYFKTYLKRIIWISVSFIIIKYICNYVKMNLILSFVIQGIICVVIFNILFILMYRKTNEFKYFYDNFFVKIFKKIKIFKGKRNEKEIF